MSMPSSCRSATTARCSREPRSTRRTTTRTASAPTYGEHREALELGRDDYVELQAYARELGLMFFATAFDFASADLLAELDVPAFKLASGDLRNTPLLRHVAALGKPIVLSTGGATSTTSTAPSRRCGRSTTSSASCSAPPPTRRRSTSSTSP